MLSTNPQKDWEARMFRHTFPAISPLLAATITLLNAISLAAEVDFGRDIQPLLRKHCIECHGPTQQMRGLRLDRRKYALPNRIGANGVRIVPGKSEASTLYKRISGTNSGPQMPPAGALSAEQIALVKTWIDEGADWPDAFSGDRSSAAIDPVVEQLAAALRNNERPLFRKTLDTHPQTIHARGRAGWTPLMYAALYGAPEDLSLLLDRGAKPNEVNDDGATALMYAVDDLNKTRLLLERPSTSPLAGREPNRLPVSCSPNAPTQRPSSPPTTPAQPSTQPCLATHHSFDCLPVKTSSPSRLLLPLAVAATASISSCPSPTSAP
jgi:mono/diheme cytochrome c family protein